MTTFRSSTSGDTRADAGWSRRHRWGVVACAWSAIYTLVALGWMLGAPGYPYGVHLDPSRQPMSLLDPVPRSIGAAVRAAATASGLIAALWLVGARRADPS